MKTTPSAVVWAREEGKCRIRRALLVNVPADGESARMPIIQVLMRKIWIPEGGIYVLRDGETVMYVGLTRLPLGARLRSAIANGRTWTRADYRGWTVTIQRATDDYGEARLTVEGLIALYGTPHNKLGRPRLRPGWV